MNPPIPMYRDQLRIDTDHLKLLSIFHFIGAGFALLGLAFLSLHFMIMRTVFANPDFLEGTHKSAPAIMGTEVMSILKWFYLAGALWQVVSFVVNILSGLFLRVKKHRTFSLVVAGLNCIHMPLGTILGIFTMIVLMRPTVQHEYQFRT